MNAVTEKLQEQSAKEYKPWQFKAGQSGNPAGRPKGSRNKLQTDFFEALQTDFKEHGREAIEAAREDDPLGYVKVVASLMPKEFTISQPLEELTDEQLDAAILTARTLISAANYGVGASGAGETQHPAQLQAIPEAT